MNDKTSGRTVYLDYLRVFATIAVMLIHISGDKWAEVDVSSFQWQTFNFYNSVSRWGAAVFVMISGAIFLNRQIPTAKIYSRYILRLAAAFAAWSVFYAFYEGGSRKEMVQAVIYGCYHMWFILMIIGVYACIPFLRAIAQERRLMMYFFGLAFVFAFLIPEATSLIYDFGGENAVYLTKLVNRDIRALNLNIIRGFPGYFLLGYFLCTEELSRRQRHIIYGLGLLGFALTIALSSLAAIKTQAPTENYYDTFTVNVLFECMAVFVWFKYRRFENAGLNRIFQKLSKYSFGAYLVHVLFIRILRRAGFDTLMMNPVIAVIVILAAVCILSFAVSAILNHIPGVRKYLV